MKIQLIPDSESLPDGVYIGLDEERYFAQMALGSTDLAKLWLKGPGWWWQTKRNPYYKEPEAGGRVFGSGAHALLLEGRAAYDGRFYCEPNPRHYKDLLVNIHDIRSALEAAGAPKLPFKATKDQYVEAARAYLPDRNIWDVIIGRIRHANQAKAALSSEEGYYLECMYEMAMDDPIVSVVCTSAGGVCLPEISVLYTLEDGIRLRFRFDSLLPSFVADLKTLDNYRDRDLSEAIALSIGDYALDVQAALSFEARKAAYVAITEGRVYGGTQDQVDWISRFPEEAPLDLGDGPGWFFLWIFYQKPDASGRAPVISPVRFHYGSQAHLDGYRRAMVGLNTYREYRDKFGLEAFWRRTTSIFDMSGDGRESSIAYPFRAKVPFPVAGEEEAVAWRVKN